MAKIVRVCYQCDDDQCCAEIGGGISEDRESQEVGLDMALEAGWCIDEDGQGFCPDHRGRA